MLHVCVHTKSLSRVWLCAALWTVAHRAPLSTGLSRQEHRSRLPCPPPGDRPDPEIEPESHVSCIGRWVLYHWHRLGSPLNVTICSRASACTGLPYVSWKGLLFPATCSPVDDESPEWDSHSAPHLDSLETPVTKVKETWRKRWVPTMFSFLKNFLLMLLTSLPSKIHKLYIYLLN